MFNYLFWRHALYFFEENATNISLKKVKSENSSSIEGYCCGFISGNFPKKAYLREIQIALLIILPWMQVQKTEVYISNYLTAPCARRQISLDTPVFFKSGILFLHCLTVFSCLCFVTASFPFPQPSLH